ncbi:unnamed protein product [Prorocentrum cordatum]|uniref:Uncharacterized protein n=1 Tax=Prorocentrum cordatum TaxID=2364126 RepID=A0ABN9WB23_9DINO|nr:unnamed protein product [Polarella glacialis]
MVQMVRSGSGGLLPQQAAPVACPAPRGPIAGDAELEDHEPDAHEPDAHGPDAHDSQRSGGTGIAERGLSDHQFAIWDSHEASLFRGGAASTARAPPPARMASFGGDAAEPEQEPEQPLLQPLLLMETMESRGPP